MTTCIYCGQPVGMNLGTTIWCGDQAWHLNCVPRSEQSPLQRAVAEHLLDKNGHLRTCGGACDPDCVAIRAALIAENDTIVPQAAPGTILQQGGQPFPTIVPDYGVYAKQGDVHSWAKNSLEDAIETLCEAGRATWALIENPSIYSSMKDKIMADWMAAYKAGRKAIGKWGGP